MRRTITLCLFILQFWVSTHAQPPELQIQPQEIPTLPGLHSFVWAKWNQLLLIVGGRTDGLHQKQPFAAFEKQFRNDSIYVLDLESHQIWRSKLSNLSTALMDQLQSTNMEFHQNGDQLICIGGYGYGENLKSFSTYPALVILQIPEVINAIQEKKPLNQFIKKIDDPAFAVCGGYLGKIKKTYYLVGGHRFDGKYNPHGPDHGPGFFQQYTNQVRRFQVRKNGTIKWMMPITDSALLHRRDMNVLPQYDSKGNIRLTIFSGVFQQNTNLPFKTLVDIRGKSVREVPKFEQQFSHYHNAHLSIHDRAGKQNFNFFFGGIAESYRDENGTIQHNNQLPFSKNISVVIRHKDSISEQLIPYEFPVLLGASAAWIPTHPTAFDKHGILQWDRLPIGKHRIGFIMGGIVSAKRLIFWPGGLENSYSNKTIWEVTVIKN